MAQDASTVDAGPVEAGADDDFWMDDAASVTPKVVVHDSASADDETTQITRPTVPSTDIEVAADRIAGTSLTAAGYDRVAEQLVESLWALGERNDRKLHGVSVTLTLDDGATVSVAAQFTGDEQ